MPKALERKLMRQAHEKGLYGKDANHYVYGIMTQMGLMKKENEEQKDDTKKETK